MRHLKIVSHSRTQGSEKLEFQDGTRYRFPYQALNDYQLQMYEEVAQEALSRAEMTIQDIDLIVVGCAGMVQMIPSTSALLQERIGKGTGIPCFDVNSTCTSFVTALDVVGSLLETGRYHRALVVSGDLVSHYINPVQEESYRLFSDGAAAFIVEATKEEVGIVYAAQETWSEGAHETEVRGGLTHLSPTLWSEDNAQEYLFDMDGFAVLKIAMRKLPKLFKRGLQESGLTVDHLDKLIPHQASPALALVTKKLKLKEGQLIDYYSEFGNMVSASIPYTLSEALDRGEVKEGDLVALYGTAAGLTLNLMFLQL